MNLSNRMKLYEQKERTVLLPNIPVVMRLDGRSFHNYTRKLQKPWDENLQKTMIETANYLTSQIEGARMAYTQSDEISIIMMNKKPSNKDGNLELWFDYNIQKLTSISASMATAKFNEMANSVNLNPGQLALFDSRVYNCPMEEIENYLIFRQQDAVRNSIQSLAQANFSHKSLQKLSCNKLQDKLFIEKNINWNDMPSWNKRGIFITKKSYLKENALRSTWCPMDVTPDFSDDESRELIVKLLK